MFATMLLALPLAVVWMVVTSEVSLGSFVVGFILSAAILLLVRAEHPVIQWRRLPNQLIALVVYTVTLGRDIVMCAVDVARRVVQPNMRITPGILAVPTQQSGDNDFLSAFSAHGITITPGELVVDFDNENVMYVHCLDVEASAKSADGAQTKRLVLLQRILGSEA